MRDLRPPLFLKTLHRATFSHFSCLHRMRSVHSSNMFPMRAIVVAFRFKSWAVQWHEGFNHILYGYGSKRELLEDFLEFASNKGSRVIAVLDGAKPSASVRQLLELVAKQMLKCSLKAGSVVEQVG